MITIIYSVIIYWMSEGEEFIQKISVLKNEYYSSNREPLFFKNTFKNNCAVSISEKIGLDNLLQKTVYIVPNTNKIYMDYQVFKQYACHENYSLIVDYILMLITSCINKYGNYETHIDLNTFSISACDRYKDMIRLFCSSCISNESSFCDKLVKMYIYNTPNMFHQIKIILRPFIDSSINDKLVLYKKEHSGQFMSPNNMNIMKN